MEWRPGNRLGIAVLAAAFACSFLSTNAHAGVQEEPLPDLITAEQIKLEEFEPAVRDQISRAYEEARKKSQDGAAVGRLGMMFQVYGKYELAESCYLRARGLDPRTFRWPYYLGIVEKSLGKNAQAIGHNREALNIDPNYAPARVRLAQLLFDAGDAEQSAEMYRSVISQNKRLATAYFGLGQVLAARADWPAACSRAVRLRRRSNICLKRQKWKTPGPLCACRPWPLPMSAGGTGNGLFTMSGRQSSGLFPPDLRIWLPSSNET